MNKTQEFIEKCQKIHKGYYDYSKVEYKNVDTKVLIICPEHGEFWQTPYYHKKGRKCKKCADQQGASKTRIKEEEFLNRVREKYGELYNFPDLKYIDFQSKIQVFCNVHFIEFETTPNNLLRSKIGCMLCGVELRTSQTRTSLEDYLSRVKQIHSQYDYSLVTREEFHLGKISIICPKHGKFIQHKKYHLHNKSGCPRCKLSKGENEIANILNKHQIEFIYQKTFKDLYHKSKNAKLRYDFFLPKYNVLIEYDGQQHYQGSFRKTVLLEEIKYLDNLKNHYAEKNGITLLRIPFFKFKEIETIIKDLLGIE